MRCLRRVVLQVLLVVFVALATTLEFFNRPPIESTLTEEVRVVRLVSGEASSEEAPVVRRARDETDAEDTSAIPETSDEVPNEEGGQPLEKDEIRDKTEEILLENTVEKEAPEEKEKIQPKIIEWKGLSAMERFITSYWEGNLFCETIDQLRKNDPTLPLQFQITFGCQELFEKSCCGTGNFLELYYGMRLAAHVYPDVDVHFTCHDAEATRHQLILPWLTGDFPARRAQEPSLFPDLTPSEACGGAYQQPVGHMIHFMQQELRHMAVSLVGPSNPAQEKAYGASSYQPTFVPQLAPPLSDATPPYPNVTLDDAVLHFRCGDLMDSDHASFAFMNFHGYVRHIAPDVTSIGILTQPFAKDTAQVRRIDSARHIRDRCRTVVYSLVEYIQQRFPHAQVRIHNDEPIALTYSRMILAPGQAVAGISTFGAPPAVATMGTAFVRIPDHPVEVNQWLLRPRLDTLVDNVVLTEDRKMPVQHIKRLWEEEGEAGVLAWFWNDTWSLPEEETVVEG